MLTLVRARGVLRVVVDLAGVAFLASSGIGVLMGARRVLAAAGGSLVLAAPRGEVVQILSLTGVGEVIPVTPAVADAIARWEFLTAQPVRLPAGCLRRNVAGAQAGWFAAPGSRAMLFLCLGETAGEFTDGSGADQLAYGRVAERG